MTNVFVRGFLAAVASVLLPTTMAVGQTSECTYDVCALRIEQDVLSTELVRGIKAERVASLGFFAPHVDVLAAAEDSARYHYVAFRSQYDRSTILTVVSLALGFAAVLAYRNDSRPNDGLPTGFLLVGLGFGIGGSVSRASAANHLQQSIWFYNRGLPRGP